MMMTEIFEAQKKRSDVLRGLSLHERKEKIKKWEKIILREQKSIQQALYADLRKPETEANLTEIYTTLSEIRHTLSHITRWAKPKSVDVPLTLLGASNKIQYEPKGVCLIISPWNYPFNLSLSPLISCLAAGNTAILKPSEWTPHTSALIKKLVTENFSPEEIFVVEGDKSVSQELMKLPFDHIFFTGATSIGKEIMKSAAEHLTSVTLELGGKSPAVIDETASLEDAAKRIAFSKFINCGQTCIAPDYVLIHQSKHDEFVHKVKTQTEKLFAQPSSVKESPDYARLVHERHIHRLKKLTDDSVQEGTTLFWHGEVAVEEKFFHPTILTNVKSNHAIMQEEIFGPILPVITYQNEDEILPILRQQPKPLAAYIFSQRKTFSDSLSKQLSAGAVCINECMLHFSNPHLPFGGVNHSGMGKSHGYAGFLAFSNEKPILTQRSGWSMPYLIHPPYNGFVKRMAELMIRFM